MSAPSPRVLVGPEVAPWLRDAVVAGGGVPVDDHRRAEVILWRGSDHRRLSSLLRDAPDVAWVQLGAAGTDAWAPTGLFHDSRIWTSAKGAYSEAVAEHALALTLALLRDIPRFSAATSWLPQFGRTLFDRTVFVLGAEGGIGREVIRLLAPFRVRILSGGRDGVQDATTGTSFTLEAALGLADVMILATALTSETRGMIGRAQFAAMRRTAVVVNIARGAVIDTDALVEALAGGEIAAAALDVTDPEPLPADNPLWALENCLITPHTANTPEMLEPQFARRITDNLMRFASGRPLLGVIDAAKGY